MPLWHGVVLVAGGAVGAGMFALPLVAAGAWYLWSLLGLLVVWWITFVAAKLLIQVNSKFEIGSSFDTLVRRVLGPRWALINNLSIAFIMFILMYAYITAGSRILQGTVSSILKPDLFADIFVNAELSRASFSLAFALVVAALIYLGTSMVSRVSTALMLVMAVSFCSVNYSLLATADLASVMVIQNTADVRYLAAALPVFVTAFACAGLVPSLISHYPQQPGNVVRSVFYGSLVALFVYVFWLAATLGNIPRTGFIQVANDGGGLAALLQNLISSSQRLNSTNLNFGLSWFSHFAVITSFLSIALGLVHFLNDRFGFGNTSIGKLKSVLAAFLLPTLFSLFSPYGFVRAIGFAGLFVAFSFFIIPALMHVKIVDAGRISRQIVIIFGCAIIALKLASIASVLPVYP